MTTHHFTLFLTGRDVLTDEAQDALFEAGCDDALFGELDGAQYAEFDREGTSFTAALRSGIQDITSTIPDVHVRRVEPDELVTMASIAERSGLSREYVRLLTRGQRGPGGFPPPVGYADRKTRLWHWPDVAHWLSENRKAKTKVDVEGAELIAAMNAAFDLRQHSRHLKKQDDLALVAECLGDNPLVRN